MKTASCVSTTLVQELCCRLFFFFFFFFFFDFSKICRIAIFQISGWLLQISPEINALSAFLVQFLLKKYVYVIIFAHVLRLKVISCSLQKRTLIQDHVVSWDKFDKICGILFWKMFPFGLTWVNKKSHKSDLTLSHVKS